MLQIIYCSSLFWKKMWHTDDDPWDLNCKFKWFTDLFFSHMSAPTRNTDFGDKPKFMRTHIGPMQIVHKTWMDTVSQCWPQSHDSIMFCSAALWLKSLFTANSRWYDELARHVRLRSVNRKQAKHNLTSHWCKYSRCICDCKAGWPLDY